MNLAAEFPQNDLIWLNHAGVSPWPARTAQAVEGFAKENIHTGPQHYSRWLKKEIHLKSQIKRLIGASSTEEIALVKNTSEALSIIAYGIRWHKGDHIILLAEEFPSNRIVWEPLQQFGVELSVIQSVGVEPEQAILNAITPKTRLITISSVQYGSGTKINLKPLGEVCHQNNIYFCVDVIQEVGINLLDMEENHIDFAAADGHKWMMGPEGLGFLYCSNRVMNDINLRQYGWHMVEDMGNYDTSEWEITKSARRFECGSPNLMAVHALSASLSILEEAGPSRVTEAVKERTLLIRDFVTNHPDLEAISPLDPERLAGIFTFSCQEPSKVYKVLKQHKIYCAPRHGGIRFSPHFYTPIDKIDKALQILGTLIAPAEKEIR